MAVTANTTTAEAQSKRANVPSSFKPWDSPQTAAPTLQATAFAPLSRAAGIQPIVLSATGETSAEVQSGISGARERQLTTDNLSMAAAATGRVGNQMASGYWAGKLQQEQGKTEKEKKEKEESEFRRQLELISRLQEENRRLQQQIDKNTQEIREIEGKLEKVDEVQQLLAEGKYDPKNEAHRKKLKELGIDPDASPEEISRLLREKETAYKDRISILDAQNTQYKEQIDRNTNTIEKAQRGEAYQAENGRFVDPQMEEARSALKVRTGRDVNLASPTPEDQEALTTEIMRRNEGLYNSQVTVQQLGARDTQELETRQATIVSANITIPAIDEEVGSYNRLVARAETLPEAERINMIREAVEKLSEDAKIELLASEEGGKYIDINGIFKEPPVRTADASSANNLNAPRIQI